MNKVCPKCGAERKPMTDCGYIGYYIQPNGAVIGVESIQCLRNQLAAVTAERDQLQQRVAELEGEQFLLHLVDVVWGEAHENESVPATDYAQRMIQAARDTFQEAAQADEQ